MLARIAQPEIYAEAGSNQPGVQKQAVTEKAAQSWLLNTLVYTSGTGAAVVLEPCLTAAVLCYGLCPDASKGTTSPPVMLQPPQALFGLNHFPFDVRDRFLEINASNASASGANIGLTTGVTWNGGGTSGVALAPGQQYGLIRLTSGIYAGYQMLDVTNTTQKFFEIVDLSQRGGGQSKDDNNPRLIVKVIPTLIQA
jgi:hypothetical protein